MRSDRLAGRTGLSIPQSRRRHLRRRLRKSRRGRRRARLWHAGIWFDYDNDGWPDLYVANDIVPKYLYHNNHDGTFEDVSLISGAAVDVSGKAQSTMGVSTADFDHSGRLGIYITNFNAMSNTLYWNQGEKGFTDISFASGLGPASMQYVAWGTAFLDMDNDGWVDLLVANGQVYPQADLIPGITAYRQPLMLFRNKRDRTFEDVEQNRRSGQVAPRFLAWRRGGRCKQRR